MTTNMQTLTIPARKGVGVRVGPGDQLRVINTHGAQVVDFWAFNSGNTGEFMSMAHTHVHTGRVVPKVGDSLWTSSRRLILRLLEDTSGGIHDTQVAACDPERYRLLGVKGFHDSCHDNLHQALASLSLACSLTPPPLNLFMNCPIEPDGSFSFQPAIAPPGSFVTFAVEMDAVVVLSSCPQDQIPISGEACIPKDCEVEVIR
jgi:uncharacterized protein YcgI (DUF1989 family)